MQADEPEPPKKKKGRKGKKNKNKKDKKDRSKKKGKNDSRKKRKEAELLEEGFIQVSTIRPEFLTRRTSTAEVRSAQTSTSIAVVTSEQIPEMPTHEPVYSSMLSATSSIMPVDANVMPRPSSPSLESMMEVISYVAASCPSANHFPTVRIFPPHPSATTKPLVNALPMQITTSTISTVTL